MHGEGENRAGLLLGRLLMDESRAPLGRVRGGFEPALAGGCLPDELPNAKGRFARHEIGSLK